MASKQHVQAKKRAAKEQRARLDAMKRRQRAAERRRTLLTVIAGLSVGVLLVGLVAFTKWNPTRTGYVAGASSAAKKAGCTGVRNDGAEPTGSTPIAATYGRQPPSSGRYNPDPLPEQPAFHERTTKVPLLAERAVANLRRGFVIAWYDDKLPKADVDRLKAATTSSFRLLAVPWTRGTFAGDRHLVLTAWQRSQRCKTVSAEAITAFTTTYINYKTAPEPNGAAGTPVSPAPSPATRPSGQPSPATRPSPSPSAR